MTQSASTIMMVRPASFQFNAETAQSNEFQQNITGVSAIDILEKALSEFDTMVEELRGEGINVVVIDDTPKPIKPDAIFPNNWISMGQDGLLTIFPMKNKNRQIEKRSDIVDKIQNEYNAREIIDLSSFETEDRALEGTGSIVYDHTHRKAYACISPRTDVDILMDYCKKINYEPVVFHAYDDSQKLIYHTNVVMCVGSGYVVIGLDTVEDSMEKEMLLTHFRQDGLELIELTQEQLLRNFAGNMLQVENGNGNKFLVMSKKAYGSLSIAQLEQIEKYVTPLPVSIEIIETIGGGSARCMMAEIFMSKK